MSWNRTALLFIVSVNLAIYMLSMAGVPFIVGFNATVAPSDITGKFELDENSTVTTLGGEQGGNFIDFIYDVIRFSIGSLGTIIYGLPQLLSNMGAPAWITYPLYAVWTVAWFLWFLELRSGRDLA